MFQTARDKGTKASPGYFYGVSKHAWQAFAVGAYVMEGGTHKDELQAIYKMLVNLKVIINTQLVAN